MRLLGLDITRKKDLSSVAGNRGGWMSVIREAFSGAWQRNVEVNHNAVLAYNAVFACQTLIASDIAKLRCKLVAQDSDGIWSEVKNAAYSPVLRKPNDFQTRIQFFENWVLSKLQRGNTYVLKQRDGRGVVVKLYVLEPTLVKPLVSTDGQIFYELHADNISGIEETIVVPAREIIHDRFNCLFHPLVGISPIYANGLAATHGLAIQNASTLLFQNGARPSGILTAPGEISEDSAKELKEYWNANFTGTNTGKVAVLGDGLKFEQMSVKATDNQLIEQLRWSAEVVCSTYHVPPYKIGIGSLPYNNVQALNIEYYSQCLQILIESMEVCLDEGLATGDTLGTEFDVENLLRMDSVTQMDVLSKSAGILTIDEMRAKVDRKKVTGGDTVYLQQQNYSLAALAKRDASDDPFASQKKPVEAPPPAANENVSDEQAQAEARAALDIITKGLANV